MGAYKQFLASDVIVSPFEVSKGFTFRGNELTGSNVGIDRLIGQYITAPAFNSGSDPISGIPGRTQYQRLVYNSIKQLYYTNYSSSEYSDPVNNPILVPGRDEEGNRFVGALSSPRFDNYLQTNLSYPRYISPYTSSIIGVLSIPAGLYGNFIQPNSFIMSFPSGTFYDDGQGNILTGSTMVGNITYTHGIIALTGNKNIWNSIFNPSNPGNLQGAVYGNANTLYGTNDVYGTVLANWISIVNNFYSSSNFTCSFSSSYNIYETQYKCTIRENEFNFSLNPSTISGSYNTGSTAGTLYGFATESYFSPYITTVGLYDEQQNLLAIGKLSQPLPSSPTTDTTILINIDK